MSQTRKNYEAKKIHETPKAVLLEVFNSDMTCEIWFPKRWAKDLGDGKWELTISRVDKSMKMETASNVWGEKHGDFYPLRDPILKKESEKAVCLEVDFILPDGNQRGISIWFPKTQLYREDGRTFASRWIISQKENELGERFHAQAKIEIDCEYTKRVAGFVI